MKAIETFAIFDEEGKMKIENLPSLKNRKVKLLILLEEEDSDLYSLAYSGLSDAYASDEPDYDLSLVKEKNEDYAGR